MSYLHQIYCTQLSKFLATLYLCIPGILLIKEVLVNAPPKNGYFSRKVQCVSRFIETKSDTHSDKLQNCVWERFSVANVNLCMVQEIYGDKDSVG